MLATLQGLVRIAEQPQGLTQVGEAIDPWVLVPIDKGMGAMLLGIVQGHRRFKVRSGRSPFARPG